MNTQELKHKLKELQQEYELKQKEVMRQFCDANNPYKVGDKVSCSRCDVCWITSIVPKRYYSRYNGEIEVRINPAKKDGTRSSREFVLWSMEIDSIKKIS